MRQRSYKISRGYVRSTINTTMFAYIIVLFAACFQVITSQLPPNIPPECRGPPQGITTKPFECCKIPQVFKKEDLEECGFKTQGQDKVEPENKPHGPPDCTRETCLLQKYNLEKDGSVDVEAGAAFLDKFAEENPDFKDTVAVVKERCLGQEIDGPPFLCEPARRLLCVTGTMFSECPKFEDTDDCKAIKEHMEHCRPFFEKH